jgi:hypothetical protein
MGARKQNDIRRHQRHEREVFKRRETPIMSEGTRHHDRGQETADGFQTAGGAVFSWSESQIKSYRAVRAIRRAAVHSGKLTEEQVEQEAISAGIEDSMHAAPREAAATEALEPIEAAADVYERRSRIFGGQGGALQAQADVDDFERRQQIFDAAGRAPSPKANTTETDGAPAQQHDDYSHRARQVARAQRGGIR